MRWILQALFVAGALTWLPNIAAADTFYADLDRDGVRDVITIQTVPVPGLRVWLSASNRSLVLPTRRPILGVTTSDIDGDGHIELIASDTSARVHVWHRTSRGGLRPTRPRHAPQASSLSHSGRVSSAPDEPSGAVLDEGSSAPPVDATHPARFPALDVSRALVAAPNTPTTPYNGRPKHARGPPVD